MIGLPAHGFVLLSMPKCASTSLVQALQSRAELVLRINPRLKHMNCQSFHKLMVPVLRNGGYERDDYELVSLFRRIRPAIVHTHTPKAGVYGRLAARLARVPVVVNTVHGLYALPEDRWQKRLAVYGAERLAATCSQAELVASPEDLGTLRRWRVPAGHRPGRQHAVRVTS